VTLENGWLLGEELREDISKTVLDAVYPPINKAITQVSPQRVLTQTRYLIKRRNYWITIAGIRIASTVLKVVFVDGCHWLS
jgi:hypothetical protein